MSYDRVSCAENYRSTRQKYEVEGLMIKSSFRWKRELDLI